MAKTASAQAAIESVTVKYDLFDLPTAQHKAGLAGLLLQLHHMQQPQRGLPAGAIPEVEELTPTSATIRFTAQSVQGLFDDLYDARIEEVAVKSKWAGATLKREEETEEVDPVTQKTRKMK